MQMISELLVRVKNYFSDSDFYTKNINAAKCDL